MNNNSIKKRELTRILLVMAIFVVMTFLAVFLIIFVEKSVHNERSNHLASQTETTAMLVDSALEEYINYADVCGGMVSSNLHEGDNIYKFIDDFEKSLYIDDVRFILVDSDCTWYGMNGKYGRVTAPENYGSDSEDSVVYMTQGVDSDVDSIVMKVTLENPVVVSTGQGTAEITNFSLICDMDLLSERIKSAFPYECNQFIIDDSGLMMYKNFSLGIIMRGSNIYTKMNSVRFMFGDTGENLISELGQGNPIVGEFKIENGNYFICAAPINVNNWKVCFVMNSKEISSGDYIRGISIYIALIAILFTAAVVVLVFMSGSVKSSRRQIEKEKEANRFLEQASKAKTEFLSNMSHDIRTPINGIVGMTAIAKKEDNPAKTRDCLSKIEGASMHLLSLVNDVLDMSSIESRKLVISCKPVEMTDLAYNCAELIRGQMYNRHLTYVTEFRDLEHPALMADELHLKQILLNVLSNAVKYTRDGGKIIFRMMELSESNGISVIRYEVEDNGIGMKPDFVDTIWESFSQEDGGSRTEYKGTGLGMSITKRLVELMDGTISVESTYEVGSKFTIDIPFAVSAVQVESTRVNSEDIDIDGVSILLVEDNELNLEIAVELLEDEGAVVTTAENGRIALETFESNPAGTFDLILMDIMMPEMNGLEATRAIRALDREDAGEIPIVAMTANAYEEDVHSAIEAGMNAHLSKPIEIPVMLKTISGFYKKSEE